MSLEQKKAKVISCVFTNEWKNPSGGMTYFHQITMDNFDTGTIGSMQKNPSKFAVGAELNYTIDANLKIKIISSNMDTPQTPQNSKKNRNSQQGQAQYLGYAWSYAKDLIIAGKTMKDVDELNNVARYIYDEIGKMLNNE